MERLINTIEEYAEDYLILDGLVPTISLGYIKEELILHSIDENRYAEVLDCFTDVTGKKVTDNYLISELSYGQQLILSVIIALYSSADKILFNNFFTSISEKNRERLRKMIDKSGKLVLIKQEHQIENL